MRPESSVPTRPFPGGPTARPAWLPHDQFPFTSRFIDVDGHTVHYVDEGAGPTLLFVHAGPAWSFIFRCLIDELRDDFRCVTLDFPGSGLSPARPGDRPTMAAASRRLERFSSQIRILCSNMSIFLRVRIGQSMPTGKPGSW